MKDGMLEPGDLEKMKGVCWQDAMNSLEKVIASNYPEFWYGRLLFWDEMRAYSARYEAPFGVAHDWIVYVHKFGRKTRIDTSLILGRFGLN